MQRVSFINLAYASLLIYICWLCFNFLPKLPLPQNVGLGIVELRCPIWQLRICFFKKNQYDKLNHKSVEILTGLVIRNRGSDTSRISNGLKIHRLAGFTKSASESLPVSDVPWSLRPIHSSARAATSLSAWSCWDPQRSEAVRAVAGIREIHLNFVRLNQKTVCTLKATHGVSQ